MGRAEALRTLHVGDYLVVYRVSEEPARVQILRIGHRSEVYEGLDP